MTSTLTGRTNHENTLGTVASFSCRCGSRLEGNSSVTCRQQGLEGRWDRPIPVCLRGITHSFLLCCLFIFVTDHLINLNYRLGTVHSNTVNSKFDLILAIFPPILSLKCIVNLNFTYFEGKSCPWMTSNKPFPTCNLNSWDTVCVDVPECSIIEHLDFCSDLYQPRYIKWLCKLWFWRWMYC